MSLIFHFKAYILQLIDKVMRALFAAVHHEPIVDMNNGIDSALTEDTFISERLHKTKFVNDLVN